MIGLISEYQTIKIVLHCKLHISHTKGTEVRKEMIFTRGTLSGDFSNSSDMSSYHPLNKKQQL